MGTLDLAALRAAAVWRDPFDYLIVPSFVRPNATAAINADFPAIAKPGSFPLRELRYGPAFQHFLDELHGDAVRQLFAEKFDIDLTGRPTMVTVRGQCRERDGSIHTDAASKLITVLIYMNPTWEHSGGRLRLLRSAADIEDVVAEVPPVEGTLLAFRRSDNSFHGHKSFAGPRRVIQLNWVASRGVLWRETLRHRLSAMIKRSFKSSPATETPRRRAA